MIPLVSWQDHGLYVAGGPPKFHSLVFVTQVFCYRERSAIHNGLTRFYSNRLFSDITIVAPDGQKIFVHQVVLASCSKRFADVLEQGAQLGF